MKWQWRWPTGLLLTWQCWQLLLLGRGVGNTGEREVHAGHGGTAVSV